jgi:hypothetical protein
MRAFLPILLLLIAFPESNPVESMNPLYQQPLDSVMNKAPEFFVLEWEKGMILRPQKTDMYLEIDSIGKQTITVLLNQNKKPVLYTADIETPVCADGECKFMNIKLYWTLLGEYAGFDRYPKMPLTKHDHDEFEIHDYLKLHALLTDNKSLLGRRRIDQLVEKPKMRTVNGVDAVSGATIARVKESIVQGALYSCYVAWNIVHGEIRDEIKNNSLSSLSEQMILDMLYSINADYHLFALGALDRNQYAAHYLQIARIFKTSTPLVRSVIAKSLPSNFNENPDLQEPFWEAFAELDVGSRSLLLQNLNAAPLYVYTILSTKLNDMTKNQLRSYLQAIDGNTLSQGLRLNLEKFANSNETYGYLVTQFLEED